MTFLVLEKRSKDFCLAESSVVTIISRTFVTLKPLQDAISGELLLSSGTVKMVSQETDEEGADVIKVETIMLVFPSVNLFNSAKAGIFS